MKTSWLSSLRDILTSRRELAVLFLGFSSGLPLLLSSGTLQAWLAVSQIKTETIGLFALVGLPYTLKFLWAPLIDRFSARWLGRRRSWMLLMQLAIAGVLLLMALTDPESQLWGLALLALLLATLSATQDIAIDAWRTDTLTAEERGLGAAIFVLAYRIGMIVANSVALVVAQYFGWPVTYFLMALLMGVGILATLLAPERDTASLAPKSLEEAVVGPLREFFQRKDVWALFALIVLYKFGDAFASALSTTFLIRGAGFSLSQIGVINNGLGLSITIIGGLLGGAWMVKLGLYRSLMLFGILQAVTNLGYALLALAPSLGLMVPVIALEHFTGGLGTAAFVALLMAACDARYSATQFALLSALANLGRVYIGPLAGLTAASLGWPIFFIITFLSALPGLWLLHRLRPMIDRLDARD
ncbi:muropeptide transporter AmpG [Halothiobacillus diazotrophicus]|uniref:Muropeptide transporter AmpG n=1 Tax=Halothiobacillus diazotrophicus TaxID=1860122 RepID=A0A191ZH95_9GAMM|nr:MFS transporter [Halothiobacillus diazotrophicus]ANJ67254.1 muropeptide transporter AmpG [Halothiobacillus diazotrophicus]